jgi:hypothetical protein
MQSTAHRAFRLPYYHTLHPRCRPTDTDRHRGRVAGLVAGWTIAFCGLPVPGWTDDMKQSSVPPTKQLHRLQRHDLLDCQQVVAVELDLSGADHAVHLLSSADTDDCPGDRRIP